MDNSKSQARCTLLRKEAKISRWTGTCTHMNKGASSLEKQFYKSEGGALVGTIILDCSEGDVKMALSFADQKPLYWKLDSTDWLPAFCKPM